MNVSNPLFWLSILNIFFRLNIFKAIFNKIKDLGKRVSLKKITHKIFKGIARN